MRSISIEKRSVALLVKFSTSGSKDGVNLILYFAYTVRIRHFFVFIDFILKRFLQFHFTAEFSRFKLVPHNLSHFPMRLGNLLVNPMGNRLSAF